MILNKQCGFVVVFCIYILSKPIIIIIIQFQRLHWRVGSRNRKIDGPHWSNRDQCRWRWIQLLPFSSHSFQFHLAHSSLIHIHSKQNPDLYLQIALHCICIFSKSFLQSPCIFWVGLSLCQSNPDILENIVHSRKVPLRLRMQLLLDKMDSPKITHFLNHQHRPLVQYNKYYHCTKYNNLNHANEASQNNFTEQLIVPSQAVFFHIHTVDTPH